MQPILQRVAAPWFFHDTVERSWNTDAGAALSFACKVALSLSYLDSWWSLTGTTVSESLGYVSISPIDLNPESACVHRCLLVLALTRLAIVLVRYNGRKHFAWRIFLCSRVLPTLVVRSHHRPLHPPISLSSLCPAPPKSRSPTSAPPKDHLRVLARFFYSTSHTLASYIFTLYWTTIYFIHPPPTTIVTKNSFKRPIFDSGTNFKWNYFSETNLQKKLVYVFVIYLKYVLSLSLSRVTL
jgi:hypothetical protein